MVDRKLTGIRVCHENFRRAPLNTFILEQPPGCAHPVVCKTLRFSGLKGFMFATFHVSCTNATHKSFSALRGGFPVMAKITRILAANIRRQFFFVITTTVSTRCLVQNFQLQSVSWILAEFCYNRSPQGPYTGTCTILQETINGFLCPLIVFVKCKHYH